jgi:hypothetical protein
MFRLRRVLVVALASLFIVTLPQLGLACTNCRYSPNHFGFCRDNFMGGYNEENCTVKVVDQFSGTTDCDFSGTFGECNWNTSGGPGGGGGDDCWWTDMNGNCIIEYY